MPILFLSEGCRRYSRRAVWENLDSRMLQTPWDSESELRDAYLFVANAHERLLPSLAEALNIVHGRRHGLRYWRIVLGPWLAQYLHVVYDRYRLIRKALDTAHGFTTIGLAERDFVTPHDMNDFQIQIQGDQYNLQLYTKIMLALGLDFPRKEMPRAPMPTAEPQHASEKHPAPLKTRLKRLARNWSQAALKAGQRGCPIILKNAYFPRNIQALIMLKTVGRAWINETPPRPNDPGAKTLNGKLRDILRTAPTGDEFDRVLSILLPEDIPRCFIEDYGCVEDYALIHYPMVPRAIFSANSWYCDEAFQHWAGICAERGTQLVGTQHGGYGTQRYMISVAHELEITDRYYTWGWERSGTHAQIFTMPAGKLVGRKSLPADNKRTGLLFVLATAQRFLLEFPYSPDKHHAYLLRQKLFVESLPPDLRDQLSVRPHYEDYGWDIVDRWKNHFPNVALEAWSKPFGKSLDNCRLLVTDHIYTTYLESLALGKPTILFWDPDNGINRLHPDAQPYFDELRSAGILHDSPLSAAQAVGQVYADVEAWWNEPRRQAAVERFRHRFARTSDDALSLWTAEFIRIARMPKTKPS